MLSRIWRSTVAYPICTGQILAPTIGIGSIIQVWLHKPLFPFYLTRGSLQATGRDSLGPQASRRDSCSAHFRNHLSHRPKIPK